MSDWQAMAADAAKKSAAADEAEAEMARLRDAFIAARKTAADARTAATEADQAAIVAEASAFPNEPISRHVDGKHVRLTPEERSAFKREQSLSARAVAPAPTLADLQQKMADLQAQMAALGAARLSR